MLPEGEIAETTPSPQNGAARLRAVCGKRRGSWQPRELGRIGSTPRSRPWPSRLGNADQERWGDWKGRSVSAPAQGIAASPLGASLPHAPSHDQRQRGRACPALEPGVHNRVRARLRLQRISRHELRNRRLPAISGVKIGRSGSRFLLGPRPYARFPFSNRACEASQGV